MTWSSREARGLDPGDRRARPRVRAARGGSTTGVSQPVRRPRMRTQSSYTSCCLAGVLLALTVQPARAQADDSSTKETRARVKYLIEMLASKNAAPAITGNAMRGEDET